VTGRLGGILRANRRRSPDVTGPPHRLAELPELVGGPGIRHDPDRDANPGLVVLMPHLSVARMTGGPNTVFQLTERLAARGAHVRYLACFGPLDQDLAGLRQHLAQVTGIGGPTGSEFSAASGPGDMVGIGARDVVLATWWPTAHVAARALAVTEPEEFIYLIQDFEPGFHAWSSRYALAAATYQLPFRAIVNEPILLEHLAREGELPFDIHDPGRAISFLPAVDREWFGRSGQARPDRHRLIFYARPKHPRNLFELGLHALAGAAEQGALEPAAWQLLAIGDETREWTLPGGRRLELLPRLSYQDYAAELGRSDLLLSLMLSPHTSYPPLEMAAAGGLVVTNTFSTKTSAALAAISPAIRGVPPDVDHLTRAVIEAARELEAGDRRPAPVNLPATWTESLAAVVPWLEATIRSVRDRAGQ
jgi:O-antigen biosynthesis protein